MKEEFSTEDMGKILGRTSHLVRDWCQREFIEADIRKPSGPGTQALFSREMAFKAMLVFHLREDLRLSREWIKFILRAFVGATIDWDENTLRIMADFGQEPVAGIMSVRKEIALQCYEPNTTDIFIDLSEIKKHTLHRILEEIQ